MPADPSPTSASRRLKRVRRSPGSAASAKAPNANPVLVILCQNRARGPRNVSAKKTNARPRPMATIGSGKYWRSRFMVVVVGRASPCPPSRACRSDDSLAPVAQRSGVSRPRKTATKVATTNQTCLCDHTRQRQADDQQDTDRGVQLRGLQIDLGNRTLLAHRAQLGGANRPD